MVTPTVKILGISCYYHESAAALLIDGRIVAATAEERFSRKKHDSGFSEKAIDFCLKTGGIKADELDYVAFYEKPIVKFERNLMTSLAYFPHSGTWFVDSMKNALTEKLWIKSKILERLKISEERIVFVPQHLSHAAASFYPSPFVRAAVLTLDAVGEWTTGMVGRVFGNKIYPSGEIRYPHSVGLLYSTFTAFLGFEVNDGEYKVMGMAGYGQPKYLKKVKKLYRQFADGAISLNLKYFSFHQSTQRMYSDLFVKEFSGLDKFDLACSIQTAIEEIILAMARKLHERTGETNLVYGGGVALNSVINAKLRRLTGFKDVFIFPAAGDDGGAIGAALYLYHHVLGNKKRLILQDVFLGQQYSKAAIQQFLKNQKVAYKKMNQKNLLSFLVKSLTAGRVIGWYEGRAEFGPRALGHRSILADPKSLKMKDIVNRKIKFREEFRPFAPVILAEYATKYFPQADQLMSRYMLATFPASRSAAAISAATVHVDGTSRIQSLSKHFPGRYRKLLEAFYHQTKRPILLNTSFNLKGEPIVNSPQDAYRTFVKSGLDILVLENLVIEK